MFKLVKGMAILIEILKLLAKDTDGDGRADLFDSDPNDPEVK